MKKLKVKLLTVIVFLGMCSMSYAYSYNFDFESGFANLHVSENYTLASLTTINDLVVTIAQDPPPVGELMNWSLSADITLGLWGIIGYTLQFDNMALGQFMGFDLSSFIGDGTQPLTHNDTQVLNAQFGGYTLSDANLTYDILVSPFAGTPDKYTLSISDFSLTDGNTSELLAGAISEINQSQGGALTLQVPFDLPISLDGQLTFTADPVPVPAALLLFSSGLLGLAGWKRRETK